MKIFLLLVFFHLLPKGTFGNRLRNGIPCFFQAIADFVCLDGRGFREDRLAKSVEANILTVKPPPFGRVESMEEEKGGAIVIATVPKRVMWINRFLLWKCTFWVP
eukprot:TRINITY_DN8904_c5_g1_i1.p1 TRINITY_DN8904_c5_g1~~TRINITY_DN8904_c5_g1_i1.p1  ORF type:complete len:105 (-),score=8.31 TRINITY_DN8904_c5_g1_i1:55-369(-)